MPTTSLTRLPHDARPLRALASCTLVAGALLALATPAAAQLHATAMPGVEAAMGGEPRTAGSAAARPAARRIRFEAVTSAPDTVTLAQLAKGVPMALQVVEADGRPIGTPVAWRIVRGDVGFRSVDAHTDADGSATATLGRTWWALARPGPVVIEARTRVDGMARDSVLTMAFTLVRR